MTIMDSSTAATGILLGAHRLAPTVASRAAEVEAARQVPRDLLGQLISAGCFRVLLPRSHGGAGAELADAMRVFETLARADASVAWTVMIGAGSWCDLTGLPRASFDALYADGPDMITAGAFNPTGTIAPDAGGYRVNGRWSFASGCLHADWLFGNCVEGVVDGVPQLRMAVFGRDQVVIEDTWTVAGLSGTGSHHFRADDVLVAADRTCVPLADEPCLDEPVVRIPPPALYALCIASVATGIAQGALDDIVGLATVKVPLLERSRLAANPLFQFELANADTGLRAARALLFEAAAEAWSTAAGGTPFTLRQRARLRAAAVWTVARAAEVVDVAYRCGGGTSVYVDCPLQRRLRDVHALTQHFVIRRDTLTTAGAILAGEDVELLVF
jgi:indole-3-acetate monooxygenase